MRICPNCGEENADRARFFEAMREAVERHGGVVEKFIGDAVMAVFGIPRLTRTTPSGPSGPPPRWAGHWTG